MHPNFHLNYGILVHEYKNVVIKLQKEHENPLEINFCFQTEIKSLSMCLTMGTEIIPPFSSTELLHGGSISMSRSRHMEWITDHVSTKRAFLKIHIAHKVASI
jgi:hypothetical protein